MADIVVKKKFYLHDLQKHDTEKDDSVVRKLEMSVDSVVKDIGYSIQFWQDVKIYGVDEAILYLENNYDNCNSVKTIWNKIKERLA